MNVAGNPGEDELVAGRGEALEPEARAAVGHQPRAMRDALARELAEYALVRLIAQVLPGEFAVDGEMLARRAPAERCLYAHGPGAQHVLMAQGLVLAQQGNELVGQAQEAVHLASQHARGSAEPVHQRAQVEVVADLTTHQGEQVAPGRARIPAVGIEQHPFLPRHRDQAVRRLGETGSALLGFLILLAGTVTLWMGALTGRVVLVVVGSTILVGGIAFQATGAA